jgi:hypothetical protein
MGRFLDLLGTVNTKLQIGLGASGLALKVASSKLRARNVADSADAPLVGSVIAASGDALQLNEDAAGSGADWLYTLQRPATGMTAAQTITLPPNAGTNGFALTTDGAGNTSWSSVASGTDQAKVDTTALAFGSGATVAMYTHPANAVMVGIQVVIDTPFNGTPTLSIGIAGTTSKYMASTQVDLTAAAGTVFDLEPGVVASGSAESIIATYSAGGASAGAARILANYVIPS